MLNARHNQVRTKLEYRLPNQVHKIRSIRVTTSSPTSNEERATNNAGTDFAYNSRALQLPPGNNPSPNRFRNKKEKQTLNKVSCKSCLEPRSRSNPRTLCMSFVPMSFCPLLSSLPVPE
eukprot:5391425-Amphidinium_carterae.1